MLHLFKRVYLAIDETLDTANNRLIYSQDYGYPMGTDQTGLGKLLQYNLSIEEAVGEGKTFATYLSFFQYLNDQHDALGQVVIVYADRASFVKIGTNFFKALLPLATVQDIHKILTFYTVRQSLLCTNQDFQGLVQNYEQLKNKADITEAEVSAEFFANRVNPVEFYNFFADKRADLSVELVAATYSYNGSCRDEIGQLMRAFAIKHAYMYAMEARQEIVDTCMTPLTQSVLNIANVPINQMAAVLKNAESTSMLFDDRIFPRDASTVNVDANWRRVSTVEIAKMCRTLIKVLRDISMWREDSTDKMGAIATLSAIQEINNPAAWDLKIDYLVDNLSELAVESESHKVNAILSNYIQLARKQNKELLRPFVINGCQ